MTLFIGTMNSFFNFRFLRSEAFRSRRPFRFSRVFTSKSSDISEKTVDESDSEISADDNAIDEKLFTNFVPKNRILADQQIYVIQPKIKWGPHKNWNTTVQLMLAESVALVETLPNWKAVGTSITNVEFNTKAAYVFTPGVLQNLTAEVRANRSLTGVFVNVDILTPLQHKMLFAEWRLPIYDRYLIVLLIFKTYAKSKLSKLQIALAEMPYISQRFMELAKNEIPDALEAVTNIIGANRKTKQEIKDIVTNRRVALERMIENVRNKRHLSRSKVVKSNLPIVAIIGYTNSGKTSLIKCLTGDAKLVPLERMFATLDVSLHLGILPSSGIKTYFADTVGFISNIPTTLVASFEATLDDIRFADLIVHIRDISHPDSHYQNIDVLETLKKLSLPEHLMQNMIEVCNKVDLVENQDNVVTSSERSSFCTSCITGQGIPELQNHIDNLVRSLKNYVTVMLKVPNGGEELRFLEEKAGLKEYVPTEDGNHLFVKATMKDLILRQFLLNYGNLIHTAKKKT